MQTVIALADQIAQSRLKAPPAPAAPLWPADPAAQLGGFGARNGGGKGRVGGVEQMVALVEHDPLQVRGLAVGGLAAGGAGAVIGGLVAATLATLFLLRHQLNWMLDHGGLEWAASQEHAMGVDQVFQ